MVGGCFVAFAWHLRDVVGFVVRVEVGLVLPIEGAAATAVRAEEVPAVDSVLLRARMVVDRVVDQDAGALVKVCDAADGVGVRVEPRVGLAEPGGVEEFQRWEARVRYRVPAGVLRQVKVVLSGREPAAPSGRADVRLRVWGRLGDVVTGGPLPRDGAAAAVASSALNALAGSPRVEEAARGWSRLCAALWDPPQWDPVACEHAVRALACAPECVWETAMALLPEWVDGPDVWVSASFALGGHPAPPSVARCHAS